MIRFEANFVEPDLKKYTLLMRTIFLFAITLCSFLPDVLGQSTHYYSEGLAAGPFHQYGREALYKDELAYALNTNVLISPQAGGTFSTSNNKEILWKTLKADSLHRFRSQTESNLHSVQLLGRLVRTLLLESVRMRMNNILTKRDLA